MKLACAIVLLIAAFGSTAALAQQSHGRFYCDYCRDPNDVENFIPAVVNLYVAQWHPGDTVNVCNGTVCWIATWRIATPFLIGGVRPDTGGPYKNGGPGGGGGNEGGGGGGGNGSGGSQMPAEGDYVVATVCVSGGGCSKEIIHVF